MAFPLVTEGIALAIGSCAGSLAIGAPLPGMLTRIGAGKIVRSEEPEAHQVKTGTPSMAGLLFILVSSLIAALFVAPTYPHIWLIIVLVVVAGTVGFVDDLLSSSRFNRGGISPMAKAGLLLIAATAVVAAMNLSFNIETLRVPFHSSLSLGLWFIPLGIVVIVATTNAVNLTDGLDGLAGGTVAIACLALIVVTAIQGSVGVTLWLLCLFGALLGFLWQNVNPARFFMGDTGALALGAGLAGACLLTGNVLILPIVGVVFVAETLSVIIQVTYFRRTGGRRVFRMTPLHLHFELGGWSEPTVVQRFWLIGAMGGLVGVGLAVS